MFVKIVVIVFGSLDFFRFTFL